MGGVISSSPNVPKLPDYYDPTPADVQGVRSDMLAFLPLELIDVILELAQYWPYIVTHQNNTCQVMKNAALCLILTPPIAYQEVLLREQGSELEHGSFPRIRRVRFATLSHDQGWGGDPGSQGTYNSSWTWFEAAIVRRDLTQSQIMVPAWIQNYRENQQPGNAPTISGNLEVQHTTTIGGQVKSAGRWHVQTNLAAVRTPKEHIIEWGVPSGNVDIIDDEPATTFDDYRGFRDGGKMFMQVLEAGDMIALFARAQFPGWENYVLSASVEVWYSV